MSVEDARMLYIMAERNALLAEYTFPANPSSDGYYHIFVWDNSKKSGRRQIKSKTLEELKEKVYQYEIGGGSPAGKTFAKVFEILQEEKLRLVKDQERKASVQNTVYKNRADYRRFFADTGFEKKYVQEITKRDVEHVIEMNLNRYDLREKAYLSMRSIIKNVLEYSFEEYWVTENVYRRVNFSKFKDLIVPDVPIEERAYSDEEVERMLAYIHERQKKDPTYMPPYALELQIYLGMRRGEVPPLQRQDVTDEDVFIHREQLTVKEYGSGHQKMQIVKHTKNYTNRKFPRTKQFNEFYKRLVTILNKYHPDSEYLFPADTELGCITNNMVPRFFARMCSKLGLPVSREFIRGTHSLRRNAITKVVNASGGNLVMASELFGNTPKVARKNYYTSIGREEALRALEG
jgi:integrase